MVNSNSSAHHVIERQHTVGFAAAECSFKLDNRFAALAGNPLERFYQQPSHAFRHIGTGKKLYRVSIFNSSLATGNLCQIRCKLSGTVTPFRNIRMGLHNVTPAWKMLPEGVRHDTIVRLGFGRLGLCRSSNRCCRYGAFLGAITELTIKSADFLYAIGVKGFAEKRHRVQSSLRITFGKILPANVCCFIANTYQLFRPCAIIQ